MAIPFAVMALVNAIEFFLKRKVNSYKVTTLLQNFK